MVSPSNSIAGVCSERVLRAVRNFSSVSPAWTRVPRRFGELAIGTNYRIDRYIGSTLYDEKIGGTVHIALGNGYPETGSRVRSAIHWDLICDLRRGGRVTGRRSRYRLDGPRTQLRAGRQCGNVV